MKHFIDLTELHRENGWTPPQHALFSVVSWTSSCLQGDREFTSDCYIIALKKIKSGEIVYGRTKFDHDNGSMLFAKPRQIIQMKDLEYKDRGFMILIHEDYLVGHDLHKVIRNYGYFEYEMNEALHLSPREETVMWELHDKMAAEYRDNPDEYSRDVILGHAASIMVYAQRYYKRQFIDRIQSTGKTSTRFNSFLENYLKDGDLVVKGLPSVSKIAEHLNLSPRYLSDLLKQETGKTAIELIHILLIGEAKNLLRKGDLGVAEIANKLGFENSSYFTRLFKKQTGSKPLEFKKMYVN